MVMMFGPVTPEVIDTQLSTLAYQLKTRPTGNSVLKKWVNMTSQPTSNTFNSKLAKKRFLMLVIHKEPLNSSTVWL